MTAKKEATTAVVVPKYTDTELSALGTWDDVNALLAEHGVTLEYAHQVIGNGFELLSSDDKGQLCGLPLLFLEWKFTDGNNGEFVSAMVLAKVGQNAVRKVILNDGSTGICAQLKKYSTEKGRTGGLAVNKGLVRSDYTYTDQNGAEKDATTYYLSESA